MAVIDLSKPARWTRSEQWRGELMDELDSGRTGAPPVGLQRLDPDIDSLEHPDLIV